MYGPMLIQHGGRGGDRLKAAGAGVVVVLFSVAVSACVLVLLHWALPALGRKGLSSCRKGGGGGLILCCPIPRQARGPLTGSALLVSALPSAPLVLQVAMILWSYFAAVLTDPGRVPEDWHPFLDEQVGAGA